MGNGVSNYLKFDPNLQDLLKRKKYRYFNLFSGDSLRKKKPECSLKNQHDLLN
jgi:hypothetical protein